MILAGDIGGTKVVLALFEKHGQVLHPTREEVFATRDYGSFEDVLAAFRAHEPLSRLRAACFDVAGPVVGGRVETTNLPWVLDEASLARSLGVPVKLLNDLQATAYGVLFLELNDICVLQQGTDPSRKGNVAVVAAGTGLGEAMLHWDGIRYHAIASEGGHSDFAPRTDLEIDLLRYLREKLKDHVSYERVLSGPGIANLYSFLRDSGYAPEPLWLAEKLQSGDPAATITTLGLEGKEPLCSATLEMFTSLYGAEAGNLALKCVAMGGVFIAGGIAPKILPALQSGSFLRSFHDKGRFRPLMASLEVRVALNPRAPLLGAAHYAKGPL